MTIVQRLLKIMIEQKQANTKEETNETNEKPSLGLAIDEFKNCIDFKHESFPKSNVDIAYLPYLVGNNELFRVHDTSS